MKDRIKFRIDTEKVLLNNLIKEASEILDFYKKAQGYSSGIIGLTQLQAVSQDALIKITTIRALEDLLLEEEVISTEFGD